MATSLQEQLLKAGLVDKKKATQVKKQKKKQQRQARREGGQEKEAERWAQQAREEKKQRDLALNRKAQEAAREREIAAQIVQLVKTHQIDCGRGDIGYQFADAGKVKKIYVTEKLQEQLARGLVAIARLDDGYALVPKIVAEKIRERKEGTIVVLNDPSAGSGTVEEDDPYADYQIPDDLMW